VAALAPSPWSPVSATADASSTAGWWVGAVVLLVLVGGAGVVVRRRRVSPATPAPPITPAGVTARSTITKTGTPAPSVTTLMSRPLDLAPRPHVEPADLFGPSAEPPPVEKEPPIVLDWGPAVEPRRAEPTDRRPRRRHHAPDTPFR
jgi:hypothetical protein